MKKNKISKNWVNKQRRDTYVRQSKVDGYRARSAYKLKEIDEKFRIFKGGMSVIDIGAAPGSWSQYVAKVVKSVKIISVDLKEMEDIQNTLQIKGDFTSIDTQNQIKNYLKKKPDVVMSDMAVNTTGIKNIDSLPDNAKNYIYALEDFIGAKVSSISTSPEREDTILVENPFDV